MTFQQFNALCGQDSYVRCSEKVRIDTGIVDMQAANNHISSGGTVGWWVRTGYIVVDIDEGQVEAIRVVKKMGLKTLICKTPKGLHLYFKTNKDFPQKVGMIMPFGLKCDFRCANKGYVLLPFGDSKRVFNKSDEIADLPLEFTPIANRKDSLLNLKEGDGRNATLFAHLMAYKHKGATDEQIEDMANIINYDVFSQPMEDDELKKIVENTKKYDANQQGDNPYLIYNQKGNASGVNYRAINDYFVNQGDIFVLGGECYQYRDGVYKEASAYVRNTIKEMLAIDTMISQTKIMEAYRLIADDSRIKKDAADLNSDLSLVNFKNGVWDCKTKKLMPHDSKYLQTIQLPHNYEPSRGELEDTELYKYLHDVCELPDDDKEMLLKYMAYTMTLNFGLKTFLALLGPSNTGKSVLIRFFLSLVGIVNSSALSIHELNMRFYPTQLYGKLMNACADNSALPLSSIENLKKITGGDQIMYEKKGNPHIFFFTPFAKLLLSFNQMPLQLEEKSNAFYKRMRILRMDKELYLNDAYVNKLCSEQSIVEIIPHLMELLPVTAIPLSRASSKAIDALRQDSDSIHAFIKSQCVDKEDGIVKKVDFYDRYVKFCISRGREVHKKHGFIRYMRSLGVKECRHPESREACWKGLRWKRG